MVALAFDIAPGAKLEYTFDYTAELDAIGQTIEGTPTISVSPSSFAANVSSPTIDVTVKKVTVVVTVPADTVEQEISILCTANATGSPDRNIPQGLFLRVRATPPSVSNGLTTVARAVLELRITDAAQQILLADHIAEATSMIEAYCNRTFTRATVTEKVANSGTSILMISRTPIISVTSVSFDGTALNTDDYEIHDADAGMIYSRRGFYDTAPLGNTLSQSPRLNSEQKLYSVVYVGGYILPGQPGRTLPQAIERACIEAVKFIRNGRADASVKSEQVPGVYQVEYDDPNSGFGSIPAHIAKMLDPWRRSFI